MRGWSLSGRFGATLFTSSKGTCRLSCLNCATCGRNRSTSPASAMAIRISRVRGAGVQALSPAVRVGANKCTRIVSDRVESLQAVVHGGEVASLRSLDAFIEPDWSEDLLKWPHPFSTLGSRLKLRWRGGHAEGAQFWESKGANGWHDGTKPRVGSPKRSLKATISRMPA